MTDSVTPSETSSVGSDRFDRSGGVPADEFDLDRLLGLDDRGAQTTPGSGVSSGEPEHRPMLPSSWRERWWKFGFPVTVGMLVLLVPLLTWLGLRTILDSTDGQLVRRVTDPTAPGFEAAVDKTPTEFLALTASDGTLDSIMILAESGEGVGGLLSIPAATEVESPVNVPGVSGVQTFASIFAGSGLEALEANVGQLLNLSFSGRQVVTSDQWASLTAPTAPVTVTNPDSVANANGTVVFARGTLEISADQVWPYLSTRSPRESDLSRLVRQQAFMKGWLTDIGVAGPSALTIPVDVGLGRMLVALGGDRLEAQTLPVTPISAPGGAVVAYRPNVAAIPSTVAALVPLPEGAPGARPRLRILDGTGQLANGVDVAVILAAAGGQVDVVGNARAFDVAVTQIVYFDPANRNRAEEMRSALGVGEVIESTQSNSASDITVILGQDYLAEVGPSTGSGLLDGAPVG